MRDERVSLTINHDTPQLLEITGHSMVARAHAIVDPSEISNVMRLLIAKYSKQDVPGSTAMTAPADIRVSRITPTGIAVLDYSRGFGHTASSPAKTSSHPSLAIALLVVNVRRGSILISGESATRWR